MRFLGLLVASLAAVGAGIAIGATPVVNEHLHWNFLFFIPISGLAIGMAFGWGQFQIARASGARVGGVAAALLALATAAGYLGTDFGTYWAATVHVEESEAFEAGEYPLRHFVGFQDYMRMRLQSSAVDLRPGSSQETTVEMGATATTASFAVDLLGAWLGSLGALITCAWGAPYCRRCQRYKKRVARGELPLTEESGVESMEQVEATFGSNDYEAVVSLLNEMAKAPAPPEVRFKLATDERVCAGCNEATLTCRFLHRKGNEWNEGARFEVTSSPGVTARLTPRA